MEEFIRWKRLINSKVVMKRLRNVLKEAKEKIVKLNGERVCNQTSNSCGCCNWDYSLISLKEKAEILNFISSNDIVKEKILRNKLEDKACYFHDKESKSCLIYDFRPICCRYISYKIYEKSDCFKTCSPLEPCKKGKSTVIRIEKEDVCIYDKILKKFSLDEKEYCFIDDKAIPEYQEYKKGQNIKLSSIIDEFKK